MKLTHIATLLIASLLGGALQAQQLGSRYLEVADAFDRTQLKLVIQAVKDMDPSAEVFGSDDHTVLHVRISEQVADQELRAAIAGTGLTVLPGTPDLQAKYGPAPDVPVYVATGDAKADHARYVSEVETWNKKNPTDQLPQPLPYVDEQ